jgi:hypothetical protein
MTQEQRRCPKCRAEAGADEAFCSNCGAPLAAPEARAGDNAPPTAVLPEVGQPAGRPLGSRYLLTEVIGHGAMGEVWRASTREGDPVAIKILRSELGEDEALVSSFLKERQALTRLTGRNLVQIHDLVAEGGTLAIVMDLIDGPDLRTELERRGTFTPEEAVGLAVGILDGLAAVHAAGVVHGDVKPENVLLSASDLLAVPRLTDFGIARFTESDKARRHTSVVGTPEYMAPEVADGLPASPSSDIYSAGIVLYELLCGVTPFVGGSPLAVLRRHLEQTPGRPPGVPEVLWAHVASALAKDPADRPANAEQLARSLDGTLHGIRGLPALVPLLVPPAAALDARETTFVGLPVGAQGSAPPGGAAATPATDTVGHQRPRRRRSIIIGAVVAAALLVAAGGIALAQNLNHPAAAAAGAPPVAPPPTTSSTPTPTPTPTRTPTPTPTPTVAQGLVPDVVGMNLSTARTALLSAGLQPTTTEVADDTKPNGTVVAQSPPAGTAGATAVTVSVARPAAVTFLSDLSPVAGGVTSGTMTVNGQVYSHSISHKAECGSGPVDTEYNLGRASLRLNASVGLSDTSSSTANVLFEVFADGRSVFNKTLPLGEVAKIDVDMTGVLRLKISTTMVAPTTNCYNAPSSASAVWGNASITGLSSPTPSPSAG